MSVRVMSAIWDLDLPADEKIVLLALADHADDEGFCYPSIDRIAAKCCCSRSTIQRKIKALEQDGLLGVDRGVGRGHASRYTLRPEKGVKLPPFVAEKVSTETEKVSTETRKGVTAMTPESSVTIKRTISTPLELSLDGEVRLPPGWSRDEWEVFDHWQHERHRALRLNGSGPRQAPTAKRRARIRARLAEGYSVDDLKRAVDSVLDSKFHLEGGHTDIELICRDQQHVEGYLRKRPDGPKPRNQRDEVMFTPRMLGLA